MIWHDQIPPITDSAMPEIHFSHPNSVVYDTAALLRSFYNATGPLIIEDDAGVKAYIWHSNIDWVCNQYLYNKQVLFGTEHLTFTYVDDILTFKTMSGNVSIRCVIHVPEYTSEDYVFTNGESVSYPDFAPSGYSYSAAIEPNYSEYYMEYASDAKDGWFRTGSNNIPFFSYSSELSGVNQADGSVLTYGTGSGDSSHSINLPDYVGRSSIMIARPNPSYDSTFSRVGISLNGEVGKLYRSYAFYSMRPYIIMSGMMRVLYNASSLPNRMVEFRLTCAELSNAVINVPSDTYVVPSGSQDYTYPYTITDNGEIYTGGVVVKPSAPAYPPGYDGFSGPNPNFNSNYPNVGLYKITILYHSRNGSVASKVVPVRCVNTGNTLDLPRDGHVFVPRQSDVANMSIRPALVYDEFAIENITATGEVYLTLRSPGLVSVTYRQSELQFPISLTELGYDFSAATELTVTYTYRTYNDGVYSGDLTGSYTVEYLNTTHNPIITDRIAN